MFENYGEMLDVIIFRDGTSDAELTVDLKLEIRF